MVGMGWDIEHDGANNDEAIKEMDQGATHQNASVSEGGHMQQAVLFATIQPLNFGIF